MFAVCVAGMPGSGKSIVASAASSIGIPVITMGDVVRNEAKKRGLPINRQSLAYLAKRLRQERGPAAIAMACVKMVKLKRYDKVVIDGLRSTFEYLEFKKHFDEIKLVYIHASPGTRYKRLLTRGRPDDPKSWSEFVLRDLQEVRMGLPCLFYLANYVIVNENRPMSDIFKEALLLIKKWLGYDKNNS